MTKWIATGRHTRRSVYHTESDCPYLRQLQNAREITEEELSRRDRRLCKWCDPDATGYKSGGSEWTKLNHKLKTSEITDD